MLKMKSLNESPYSLDLSRGSRRALRVAFGGCSRAGGGWAAGWAGEPGMQHKRVLFGNLASSKPLDCGKRLRQLRQLVR